MGPDDIKTLEKMEIFQGILSDPQRGDHFKIDHFGTQVEIIVLTRRKKDGFALLQVVQPLKRFQMTPSMMMSAYEKASVIEAKRGDKLLANGYFLEETADNWEAEYGYGFLVN